jgi:hypothetical protein
LPFGKFAFALPQPILGFLAPFVRFDSEKLPNNWAVLGVTGTRPHVCGQPIGDVPISPPHGHRGQEAQESADELSRRLGHTAPLNEQPPEVETIPVKA